ncbi:hypothetical protein [Flavobacterium flavigenum]|uniref:hypothetical protein n=1 Tax=Flavobacterium flavigenum TaxID=3003258 RepID=UPI0024825915|nr:hypothetical protein [Flavobacterium flavigenum]
MVLRTLLKIGIETIGANDNKLVFEERFNPARKYALTGIKDLPSFYIQKENNNLINRYLKEKYWDDYHCFMDIHYEDNGLVFLHFKLYYLEFFVPLVENVILEENYKFKEPEERIIIV